MTPISTGLFCLSIAITINVLANLHLKGFFKKKTYTVVARFSCTKNTNNSKSTAWVTLQKCDQTGKYDAYVVEDMTIHSFDTEAAIRQAKEAGYIKE